jgi:four helix bundle protein
MTVYKKPAYERLKFYQDICELRKLIYLVTSRFAKTHMRLVSQMRDAARSAKQNIREGYRKGTAGEFGHSIRISQGSLEELGGDVEDCYEDKLISKDEYNGISKLINSAIYMSGKYLISLKDMEQNNQWKKPFTK